MLHFLQYRGPPVAHIQQVLVKAAVSPWDNSLVPVDVFRSPLGRVFSLLEEIRNHVYTDRSELSTLTLILTVALSSRLCFHKISFFPSCFFHILEVWRRYACR